MWSTIWKWIEAPTLTKKQAIISASVLTISFLVTFACVLYFAVTVKDDSSPAPIGTLSATEDPRYPGYLTSFFFVDKYQLTAAEEEASYAEAVDISRKRLKQKYASGHEADAPVKLPANLHYLALVLTLPGPAESKVQVGRYKSGIVLNLVDLLDEKQSASDLLKAAPRVEPAIEVDARNLSNPMYSRRWMVIEAHKAAKKSQQ